MQKKFIELWMRIGALGNPESEFRKLQSLYNSSNRFYHNIGHIWSCVDALDYFKQTAEENINIQFQEFKNYDAVEFALWYHDAIYSTRGHDNEERSANIAYKTCIAAGLSKKWAEREKELILATKHDSVQTALDSMLIVDIDISVLGKRGRLFDEYETNIRREYSWVPEEQFRQGRSVILQMFLDKEHIYSTEFFRERYEEQARENLQRSINSLR